MRVACLLVPDLPLWAELRASPELADRPLAITTGRGFRAEVLAASREAIAQGVRSGQTLPRVRALCPEIEARVASPVLERAAREAMLDVALSLAPRAELAERASGFFLSEGAVYVDAGGIEALHTDERTFASVLHARAERAGIRGFVGLAATRGIARLAARHLAHAASLAALTSPHETLPGDEADPAETTRILAPERELDFLAPLPIDLLDPDDATAQALTRFGVRRIGELLRLPRRDLAARLGPGLLALVARARGEAREPPIAEPRTTALEEGVDLEVAIESLEPLAFVFRGLVSRLTERLRLRSLGCVELRLHFDLANGAKESRRIGVASPCQDERVLLRLLRLALEARPPAAAIDRVGLVCEGVALRREQLDFFLPRGPSPSELDQTLAELSAICGAERVGSPARADDHRPDAFTLEPFTTRRSARAGSTSTRPTRKRKPRSTPRPGHPDHPENWAERGRPGRGSSQAAPAARLARQPRLTLRALRPPQHAEVQIEGGRPVFLRSAVSQGEILHAAGPWRTTGRWWEKSTHFAIDHFDVQMNDGAVLRLCFDWRTKRWQIDGLYD